MPRLTGSPCVDRHGVAIRVGDRVCLDCTVVAVREADCFVHLQVRASDRRAVLIAIDYYAAYADQVVRQPDPYPRTDRWAP